MLMDGALLIYSVIEYICMANYQYHTEAGSWVDLMIRWAIWIRISLCVYTGRIRNQLKNKEINMSLAPSSTSAPKSVESANLQLNSAKNSSDSAKNEKTLKKEVIINSFVSRSSKHEGPKTPDSKTLRRLAQNREAARKSRLRKKAYVQQLESCKIKLTQLEHELQRERTLDVFFGGGSILEDQSFVSSSNIGLNSDSVVFDMEYARWLEEHHRLMAELRAAMQEHELPENELRMFAGSCLAHYDTMMNLKSLALKNDVFHIVSGMWMTPAERCFLWIGGFRPSDLIKVIWSHVEPLTEHQLLLMSNLQHSAQETQEALTQGLESLNESLSDTISSDTFGSHSDTNSYMSQMVVAMNKLSALEGFVRQAERLRQQVLHRLCEILSARQAGRCFLAIADYFQRLRTLSSLWLSRPWNGA